MSVPAYVDIVLDLYDPQGNAITQGSVTFTPTVSLADVPDLMTIPPVPVTTDLLPTSQRQAVKLLATDSPGPLPAGWGWEASFNLAGTLPSFTFLAPAGPAAFTATGASPAVFTWTATTALTKLPNGTGMQLSGGSLPGGFTAGTTYYVVNASGSTFELATSQGGVPLASTGSGSGNLAVTQYNLSALTAVSSAVTQFPLNPMITLGDMIYGGASGTPERLAGNTTTAREFLVSQGTGTAADPPAWSAITAADLPAATSAVQGAVTLPSGTPVKGSSVTWNGTGQAYGPANGVTVLAAAPTGNTATDTPNVTAAITALTTALASGPAVLQFQDGTYVIDSNQAVIQSVSDFAVRGSGGTVIQQAANRAALPNNTTGDLFIIADCTDFRVEGITFDADRDVVSPLVPLSATCASGQPSVTVASGAAAAYQPGQGLLLFGGYGSSEAGQNDGLSGVGVESPLYITSITPGGGSGGGDLITFGVNISHNYTVISSTPVSDGFGPYAYEGAYLTPYQCAVSNAVAGRTLSGEDQQNGLHIISCQRATVSRVTSRNLWESGIKLGTGEASTSLTDGCTDVTVADCITYHGYDQGVSIWVSQRVAVHGCRVNAGGWAGISMTASDYCTVSGNISVNNVYAVPGDLTEGNGIAIEGGIGNQVRGNILNGNNYDGIRVLLSPLWWGLTSITYPTTSTFLEEQTAAGTSIQLSSTAALQQGGLYSLWDGAQTEAITIASVVDGTHVTLSQPLQYSHGSGVYIGRRVAQENVIDGNVIDGTNYGDGIKNAQAVRSVIACNRIARWGLLGTGNGINLSLTATSGPSSVGGDGSRVEGNILRGGLTQAIVAYGASGQALSGLTIAGNIIANPGANDACIDLRAVADSAVSGNRITDFIGGGNGILLNTEGSTACSRVTISHNVIRRGGQPAILAYSADSLAIRGNQVSSCGGGASVGQIYLRGVTNSVIEGNTCNSGSGSGIELNDNGTVYCLSNRLIANTCRNDGSGYDITSGNALTQQYGIRELGNSDNNLYAFNELDGNTNTQIATVGAGSVQTRNIISGVIQAT